MAEAKGKSEAPKGRSRSKPKSATSPKRRTKAEQIEELETHPMEAETTTANVETIEDDDLVFTPKAKAREQVPQEMVPEPVLAPPAPIVKQQETIPSYTAPTEPEPAKIDPKPDNQNKPVFDEVVNTRYEEIKKGVSCLADLQSLSMPELTLMASELGIPITAAITKQNLVYLVLKEKVKQNGLMLGEGCLEILPDGFGFLRSPDYNYLPCVDDIYISPSQIRR
ncbi:MAG: Rho termination factor N-terminal domain-containing protein, partial [Planctomycetia bacterium]